MPVQTKKFTEHCFIYEKNKRLNSIDKIFHLNKGKVLAGCLRLIKIQSEEMGGFKLSILHLLLRLTDSCTN